MALVVRRPEDTLIPLSDGDWILIKKFLNTGETRAVFARTLKTFAPGSTPEYETQQIGLSKVVEYLIDWSAKDPDGKPIVIRDQEPSVKEAALNMLPPEAFTEIKQAIDAHEAALDAALEQEKKDRTTPPVSATT